MVRRPLALTFTCLRARVEDATSRPPTRAETLDAVEAVYAAAGVTRFAAWVHENDWAMRADLERRGYTLAETTRGMGIVLDEIRMPRPEIELGATDCDDRIFGLPPGLLAGANHAAFHLLVARLNSEHAATAMAFDHHGDCGIYKVGTLEHARRRGLGMALTAVHLHDALARGCRTASVQSTKMAERIYAAAGFRDLGRSSNTCRRTVGSTTLPTNEMLECMRGPRPSAPCLPRPLARRPSCGSSRASSPEARRDRRHVARLRCRRGRGRRGARSRSP
jgi:GNAT superfamily N-acetyltransferase